jgi:hypothetical protein
MNFETVKNLVAGMGTMKFFPSDPAVRLALVELMGDLTDDEDKVRWLVKKLRAEYAEWPGERELRRVFCERFRPKDGVVVAQCSCGCGGSEHESYTCTLAPSQIWPPQIAPPAAKLLPPPKVSEEEAEEMRKFEKTMHDSGFKSMPKAPAIDTDFTRRLREIETAPKDRVELPPPPEPMSRERRAELEAAFAAVEKSRSGNRNGKP